MVIVQGGLRITSDVVTMHFDESYDLERFVAEGEPARFEQRLDDGPAQEGQAARIEYRVEDGTMIFTGRAQIAQGEFHMKAERIDYDPITGSIEGASGAAGTGTGRVTITLKGEKK